MMRIPSFICAVALLASPAMAQSSLGFHGLSTELAYGITQDNANTVSGAVQMDVRITDVHGLQLDFGLKDTGSAVWGQLGAHLYMQPRPDQKYGLFMTLSDMDEYSVQYVNAGIEGQFALSDSTTFDARFGVGGTTGMGGTVGAQWDYVFAGGGIQHQFGDTLTLEARLDVTEFNEISFRGVGIDSQIRLTHSRPGSNFEFFGELRSNALVGQDAAPPRTTISTGINFNFGGAADTLVDRAFYAAAPFDQLVDRGIVELE